MSLTEPREVVTVSRAILPQPGESIMLDTARKYGIRLADLRGRARCPAGLFINARVEAANRMRDELRYSVTQIGRIMHRDHSTVCWYLGTRRDAPQARDTAHVMIKVLRSIDDWISYPRLQAMTGVRVQYLRWIVNKLHKRGLVARRSTGHGVEWRRT